MGTTKIGSLFDDDDRISDEDAQAATQALTIAEAAPGISKGFHLSVDDVEESEIVIVYLLVDDSYSIRAQHAQNMEPVVIDGHNGILKACFRSKQRNNVFVATRLFNGGLKIGPEYLHIVMQNPSLLLGPHNYQAMGTTPLYDMTCLALAELLGTVKEFEDNGVPVRTITVIISDGEDQGSHKTASDCHAAMKAALALETNRFFAIGIGDDKTLFRQVFEDMGIPEGCIWTPGGGESDIRAAFGIISESVSQASQSADIFAQVGQPPTSV